VPDTTVLDACTRYEAAASPGPVGFFHSDTCDDGDLLTYVDATSDCQATAPSISQAVWGLKSGDQSVDIADTSFLDACARYKAGN
jgi:hypothetical protein